MKLRSALLALLVLALPAAFASADTIPLLIQEDVTEFGPNEGVDFLQYTAFNPPENIPVIAFAVEVDFYTPGVDFATTGRHTWRGDVLTPESWDGVDKTPFDGTGFTPDGYEFGNPQPGRGKYRTDEFGSFNELFGDGQGGIQAAQVAFYFDNEGEVNALLPGDSDPNFFYSDPNPSSVTLTIFNTPTPQSAQGVTSQFIPLPAAAWMGLGMLGLLAAYRRRRNSR